MPHVTPFDILQILVILAGTAVFIAVLRARHRGKAVHDVEFADQNVCEHLRRALELLQSRGHHVDQVGQHGPDMPLEIHVRPPFDPAAIYAELQLEPPVYVSERNVLFCKEDWCEIHPTK
jgi:FAD/FMN-containing dehydrogenase